MLEQEFKAVNDAAAAVEQSKVTYNAALTALISKATTLVLPVTTPNG